ncbi:polymorphic toxin type 30 domain-containing protein [Cellulomonas sp. Leaf334]|uniref:polymorphic toxin type 30 domain-containing protein n=1 Tax=Cellulomonas sp. Leaf334 TaxID=1736339 RepID=UPI0009EBE3E3
MGGAAIGAVFGFGVGAVPAGAAGALAGATFGLKILGVGFTLVSVGDFLDVVADWGEGKIDGQDLVKQGTLELALAITSLIGVGVVGKILQKTFTHLPASWRKKLDELLRFGRPANPLDVVPPTASRRTLKPDPNGGAQEGVEYKWINDDGQTVRLRVHSADGTAPPGSNSASGPTYRIQVGGRYMDADGNLYPRNVHNPASPNYDPAAANATHIPWPPEIPLPWKGAP